MSKKHNPINRELKRATAWQAPELLQSCVVDGELRLNDADDFDLMPERLWVGSGDSAMEAK